MGPLRADGEMMGTERERSKDQSRYNEYGKRRLQALRKTGAVHASDGYAWHPLVHADIVRALGSTLRGKRLLELGCGAGEFAVFCARQGADVTGVDLGPDLVAAAREWARLNGVRCVFQQENIVRLPFKADDYDIVVSLAVLHHLSEPDLVRALHEAYRVLRPGGCTVFFEPVQQSGALAYLRYAIPRRVTSKYGTYRRPSIWQRQAWKRYLDSLDDRYLTMAELARATRHFADVKMQPKGLFEARWLVRRGYGPKVLRVERTLLERFPRLGGLCANVLIECRKLESHAKPPAQSPREETCVTH